MRLIRYGTAGSEKPGLVDREGNFRDASAHIPDWHGESLSPATLGRLSALRTEDLPLVPATARLGPPVGRVGKIIGVGLNYADHARESGLAAPTEPIWFLKATSSLSGPNDPIQIPRGGSKVDYEVELAVIIGTKTTYVTEAAAAGCIAGYAAFNDVSERGFQLERGTQWTKGKSCDSFAPLGPYLVTPDEIQNPGNLELWLDVNGERRQHSSTENLIFSIPGLIASLSSYMTLHPGDVIATGTPAGVGIGRKPPIFLRAGDVIDLAVAGLGTQRQLVIA